MLIAVIQKKSLAEMAELINRVDTSLYDLLELRLDACADLTPEGVSALPAPLPAIFTLRTKDEGGAYGGSEEERLDMLEKLMRLNPAYIDLEASISAERIEKIRNISPNTKVILSWHNFRETPDSLGAQLDRMQARAEGVVYKMAVFANNTLDALRMLLFCREQTRKGVQLIGISMGEHGMTTRVFAPVVHSGFSYCPVEEATAPGQVDAATLAGVYNFKSLNHGTAIYGLLGDPVEQSVGHLYHNSRNAAQGINAVYVKWRISREELQAALPMLHQLGVKGLSVTMPLKEEVMPLLSGMDEAASEIGAANTLRRDEVGYYGTNTDGAGALDALGLDLQGRKIALLGAGGAAKAVAYEAERRGAEVTVFNRTPGKTMPMGITVKGLDEILNRPLLEFDLIINALPFNADFAFEDLKFHVDMVAFDLSYAKKSAFLAAAEKAGCKAIEGSGMFNAQAELQRKWWSLN